MKLHVTHNDLVSAREQLERELQRNYGKKSGGLSIQHQIG